MNSSISSHLGIYQQVLCFQQMKVFSGINKNMVAPLINVKFKHSVAKGQDKHIIDHLYANTPIGDAYCKLVDKSGWMSARPLSGHICYNGIDIASLRVGVIENKRDCYCSINLGTRDEITINPIHIKKQPSDISIKHNDADVIIIECEKDSISLSSIFDTFATGMIKVGYFVDYDYYACITRECQISVCMAIPIYSHFIFKRYNDYSDSGP